MARLKRLIRNYKNIILSAALLVAVVAVFQASVGNAALKVDESAERAQYEAIKKATVQCYALEGFFPPNMDYLIDHYGIIVDYDKFIIHYEAEGANLMPDIVVINRYPRSE